MVKLIRQGLSDMRVLCIFAAVMYFLGSVGAYENHEITTAKFLLRTAVSFLMMVLL